MELRRVGEIEFTDSVSDARFVTDRSIVVCDRSTKVWRQSLAGNERTLVADRVQVLADFYDAGETVGRFSRLAVSAVGGLVVNPNDAVLLTPDAFGAWRTIIESWGIYEPKLEFSPNGELLAMLAEEVLLVFDIRAVRKGFAEQVRVAPSGWRRSTKHESSPLLDVHHVKDFVWHPSRPVLLVHREDGALQLLDPRSGRVVSDVGKVEYDSSIQHLSVMALGLLGGKTVVIAHESNCLFFAPLHDEAPVTRVDLDECVNTVFVPPSEAWFAMETDHHLLFWGKESLAPLCDPIPKPARRWDGLRFSPSGRYMLSIGLQPTSDPPPPALSVHDDLTVWQIEPGGTTPGVGRH